VNGSFWDIGMFEDSVDPPHFPRCQTAARERQPAVVFLVVGLFAGATAICMALIAPILWVAVRDAVRQSRLTYQQQCAAVKEDASRPACYDRLLRRNSLHSAKGASAAALYMPPL